MALKYKLTKAEHEALFAELKKEYVEKDGAFVLAVEGDVVPKSELDEMKVKVGEFRDNNRVLFADNEKLKGLETKFKDVDPDEYRTLKAKAGELDKKGIKGADDITKVVEEALKPFKDALATEQKARQEAEARANDGRFESIISAEANKAGVRPNSVRLILREAKDVFDIKDGSLVPKQGQKNTIDPLKDLNPTDWLAGMAKSDSYLFVESSGGGAPGNQGGGKPGAKQLINPTAEQMGENMDAIAKGDVIVVRS